MRLFGRELTLDEIIGFVECNANPDDDLIHRAALELIAALRDAQRRERSAMEALCDCCKRYAKLVKLPTFCQDCEWRGPHEAGKGE